MIATKILIAEDHSVIRDGMKTILRERKDWAVVGEAKDGMEAVQMYCELRPDILVIDIAMPAKDGMEVAAEILDTSPTAGIVMLSKYDNEEYIGRSLKLGVQGFVIKSDSNDELVHAIDQVLQRKIFFSTRAQRSILHEYTESKRKERVDKVHVTRRELEIIGWLVKGFTSRQIALQLSISTRTVETHRLNLLKKLGVHNSMELVKKAQELGLINRNSPRAL